MMDAERQENHSKRCTNFLQRQRHAPRKENERRQLKNHKVLYDKGNKLNLQLVIRSKFMESCVGNNPFTTRSQLSFMLLGILKKEVAAHSIL